MSNASTATQPSSSAVQAAANFLQPQSASIGKRLASIDAYRGMVMFLMLAETLHLNQLAKAYPENTFFEWLRFHTSHVDWVGCSLHDTIQPSFSFLVGVSLPFSIAARRKKEDSLFSMMFHAVLRSVLLVVLGIMLRSLGKPQTYFTFEDTLTQIGLGYFPLFLVALTPRWNQLLTLVALLVGYWLLFALWPLAASDFDFKTVGVPNDWPHLLSGFAAHWNKNVNPAWAFDVWFLNLFPREKPFEFHGGGYATLSFIPTLATMIMGLLAGSILLRAVVTSNKAYFKRSLFLTVWGVLLIGSGWALDHYGVCPNVKRIWTSSFALFSGGICLVWLAALHMICDSWRFRLWAFPIMVIGANSILAYVMNATMKPFFKDLLHCHFGQKAFEIAGDAWEPVVLGASILTLMWLVLFWLYRQRVFVRI